MSKRPLAKVWVRGMTVRIRLGAKPIGFDDDDASAYGHLYTRSGVVEMVSPAVPAVKVHGYFWNPEDIAL